MAALPVPGTRLHGFTATEQGTISMLGAQTLELFHSFSGARILCIQNDDKELGFNLIYRTPQMDSCDSNHILEHLLLCSCRKYPSRDIFFDMDSKSYATFMNGITDNTYTCYPVCSQSENQLLKLMDVFLNCMEEPEALKDKHFFLREGLRYELEAADGDISLEGTVLSEDWGHLTDLQENADSFMAQTLYEGLSAANLLGRAHLAYKDITFENICETYNRYYDYSNCLIILYGDMDFQKMLAFLDKEHLSLHRSRNLNLLPALSEPVKPGFSQKAAKSPAYAGSNPEQASILDYTLDLSAYTQEELIYWDLLADMLDYDTSVWHRFAREEGLNYVMEVYLDSLMAKPALKFRLSNGDEAQKEPFLRSIRRALTYVSTHGIEQELFEASMKENRLADWLSREASHLSFNLSEEIGRYWSLTGKTDYFMLYEKASRVFSEDKEQSLIRTLAARALAPAASAFVITTPAPGMAEALEDEKARYLKDKKAAMTSSQIMEMIEATRDFRSWSAKELCNMDFLIQPQELPEPEDEPPIEEKTIQGITFYRSAVSLSAIGSYQLFFDISGICPEDWNYLTLYQMLLTELDTPRFTVEQQKNREQEYLHDCMFDELYPEKESGKNHHPMMSVLWYGLTEDFETGLDFLLELMGKGDYSDRETILRVINKYMPDYDMSKADNASSLAYSLAEGYIRQDSRYRYLLNSPDIYGFLQNTKELLTGGRGAVVSEKLKTIASRILTRNRLIFMAAASEEALERIEASALLLLGGLPQGGDAEMLPLPDMHKKTAACVDSPLQEIRMLGDFKAVPEFKGRFLPYLLAAGDKYLKPAVRYQGRAYDCGIDFLLPNGYFTLWSAADPDVGHTLTAFMETGHALEALDISGLDLQGYILSAYAQALAPSGMLNGRLRYMRRRMMGIDTKRINEMISDIRRSQPSDQLPAARILHQLLLKGPIAAAGNEKALRREAELFDEIFRVRRN